MVENKLENETSEYFDKVDSSLGLKWDNKSCFFENQKERLFFDIFKKSSYFLLILFFVLSLSFSQNGGGWGGLIFIASLLLFVLFYLIALGYFFIAQKISKFSEERSYIRNMLIYYFLTFILSISVVIFSYFSKSSSFFSILFYPGMVFLFISLLSILLTKRNLLVIFLVVLILLPSFIIIFYTSSSCNFNLRSESGIKETYICWANKALEENNSFLCEQISCNVNRFISYSSHYCVEGYEGSGITYMKNSCYNILKMGQSGVDINNRDRVDWEISTQVAEQRGDASFCSSISTVGEGYEVFKRCVEKANSAYYTINNLTSP